MTDMQGKKTQRDPCLVGPFDVAASKMIFIVSLTSQFFFFSILIYNSY